MSQCYVVHLIFLSSINHFSLFCTSQVSHLFLIYVPFARTFLKYSMIWRSSPQIMCTKPPPQWLFLYETWMIYHQFSIKVVTQPPLVRNMWLKDRWCRYTNIYYFIIISFSIHVLYATCFLSFRNAPHCI